MESMPGSTIPAWSESRANDTGATVSMVSVVTVISVGSLNGRSFL